MEARAAWSRDSRPASLLRGPLTGVTRYPGMTDRTGVVPVVVGVVMVMHKDMAPTLLHCGESCQERVHAMPSVSILYNARFDICVPIS